MKDFLVIPERLARIKEVLERRQPDLRLFLERVVNYHNVSAILRTADAVGVLHVHYFHEGELPINDAITCGAHRWLLLHREEKVKEALTKLRDQGFQLVATGLFPETIDFREVDYTRPTVIIVGHELEGISETVRELAHAVVKIPMHGMVQSLNVSVATGIILYEAERQRKEKGLYEISHLSEEEIESILEDWAYHRVIKDKARGRLSS
ncbi:tRNA guanosine-2'-O-methyltransferase [Thermodesulfatator indicus DSM 15286]|uniref:tRNA (guanosine(18)-2'-O)-methyltransferase n=1 Tax=Thermodesulfatator indicus (strain DSM 15286 / JCM 11887 / CIR29812) TaxID=667014 RepID=F8AC88_THEID|nr:RNA methyltransferase [Thermodesulfatator indicus]AEH45723.1 tRNA guanosine-2'-O-methyltransferase [Thermodesulfatator indicus DSM 15286]